MSIIKTKIDYINKKIKEIDTIFPNSGAGDTVTNHLNLHVKDTNNISKEILLFLSQPKIEKLIDEDIQMVNKYIKNASDNL